MPVYRFLGYAGLIPFYAALAALWLGESILGYSGQTLFMTYSAIILSFMAGVWWGQAIGGRRTVWLVLSNVFALAAWFTLLDGSLLFSLWVLLAGYVLLWVFEWKTPALRAGSGYFALRTQLTFMVVLAHALFLLRYAV